MNSIQSRFVVGLRNFCFQAHYEHALFRPDILQAGEVKGLRGSEGVKLKWTICSACCWIKFVIQSSIKKKIVHTHTDNTQRQHPQRQHPHSHNAHRQHPPTQPQHRHTENTHTYTHTRTHTYSLSLWYLCSQGVTKEVYFQHCYLANTLSVTNLRNVSLHREMKMD